MRRKSLKRLPIPIFSICTMLAVVACDKTPPEQPLHQNVVNVTREDVRTPAPSAGGQPALNGVQGNVYATENLKPEQLVARYGDLLHQRDFKSAYALWDPNSTTLSESQFANQFDHYKTIKAAVGKVGPTEGAAGSLYSTIQLTLSGNKNDGKPYVMTGPVTLRRVNDVPGSTAEQRQWHIVKMELTANPKAAEAILKG